MSGASAFELLPLPREHIEAKGINPNGLSLLQIAVVNLLFIFYEHSHQLDDYYDGVLLNLRELYYVNGGDFVKESFIQFLKQKYGEDPFKIIIRALMEIFDFDFVPGYDDEKKRHVVFKPGMSQHYYKTAMNSLKYLMNNNHLLPVMLPEYSLPPKGPNAWVQKEEDLMNDMKDEFAAEEAVTDAQSAADLPLPLQDYKRLLKQGILKLQPLFDHAKVNPGSIGGYVEIEVLLVNALQKVEKWVKEQPKSRTSANNPRNRSRSPLPLPLRRSDRLEKKKGGRKIKTVRRHTPNKHKKTKSRRV
jgi:hypothetical protein